jgi:glycerol kinase
MGQLMENARKCTQAAASKKASNSQELSAVGFAARRTIVVLW